VTDPELKQAVAGFIGQEAMHTREHVLYNDLLDRAGLPANRIDRFVGKFLNVLRKYTPKSHQLAVTVALEHYTAMLANQVLSHEDGLGRNSQPGYRQVWLWHAMEETEHKAVSYDVWNLAIKPGLRRYIMRTSVMLLTTVSFWLMVFYVHLRLIFADRTCKNKFFGLGRAFHFLWIHPAPLRKIIPEFFDYFRPSFHPWDEDNRAALERLPKLISEIEAYAAANGEAPSPSIRRKLSAASAAGS
jgi:predicted metal-dependent hydrolase